VITINKNYLILLSIFLASCAFAKDVNLISGAESVRIIKSDPPDNYSSIGTATGIDGAGCGYYGYFGNYQNAIKDLQNKAYKMGGSYAQIITIKKSYKSMRCETNLYQINATVFKKDKYLPTPTPVIEIKDSLSSKLREIDSLYEQHLITKEEYKNMRTKLLNERI